MYRGQVEIDNILYQFRFEDFKLFISGNKKIYSWNQIKGLVEDDLIILQDFNNDVLYLKTDERYCSSLFEYVFNISAYIIKFNRNRSNSVDKSLCFDSMIFRSDVIDYFFRDNDNFRQEIAYLLAGDDTMAEPVKRPPVSVKLDDKLYKMEFRTMMQGSSLPFPYVIRNCIRLFRNEMNNVQETFKIAKTVQLFLKFISQSPNVNFFDSIWLANGEDVDNCDTFMYLRPEEEKLNVDRVLTYEDIKEIAGSLLEMIYNEQICFRSLFPSNYDRITYADIMNVCAAFETQFKSRYQKNFRYEEQEIVKEKMIGILEQSRESEFAKDEKPLFDELLNGFKFVSETLRKRIEIALDDFKDMYGDEEIRCDFEDDYLRMPERIKNSRNALDHGRLKYQFQNIMFWDAELLRAVVYMMILETAGLADKQKIKNSVKRLSRTP